MTTTARVLEYLRAADLSRTKTVQVSDSMGIAADTLRTRLSDEDMSYMRLLLKVRLERFYARPGLSHSDMSKHLGFTSQHGLSRWTWRYFGMPYSQYLQEVGEVV